MQMNYLTGDACPVCGETTVVGEWVETETLGDETRVLCHVNGARWEHRKFACGQELVYIPNFSRTEKSDYRVCRRDPELLARRERMQRIKAEIETLLSGVPILVESEVQSFLAAIRSVEIP